MKSAILIAAMSLLTGCGSMLQAVNAYGTIAVDNAKSANDTIIAGWTTAACATPISAALRNPQIIPAIKALCMPTIETPPSHLLDEMQFNQYRKQGQ